MTNDSNSSPQKNYNPLSPREKLSIWLPLIICLAVAGGIWIGFELHKRARSSHQITNTGDLSNLPPQVGKVEEILRFIDARYLEGVEMHKLEDAAIVGLLEELDPHSSYIPLDEISEVNESLSGGFEGIGVEFFVLDDTIYVVGVIPNGPSDKAGVKVGDKIISIADTIVAGIKIENKQVISKLKGADGSEVTIGILRNHEKDLKKITIQRDQITVPSLDVAYMLDEATGYVKISRFSGKTYKEFMEAVEQMIETKQLKNLVIDLRHNPGGYLNAATDILNQLFDSRKLLVYTEGRSYKRKEYHSTGKNFFPINKIAVLIDEGSASASEILAGAIQDNDRGLIIGRRSFGKGLVQEQYDLSDGSGLRLTVARYYTPAGRLIQKPYDVNKSNEEYENDLRDRYEAGELYSKDSIRITDSTKYYTTGGRIVYGGGGIIPDIFVPMDTLMRNRYYAQLNAYIPQFVYKYLDTHRAELDAFKTYEDFSQQFTVTDKILQDFIAYTERKEVKRDEAVLRICRDDIANHLKAYLAQQLFREQGFFRILHQRDKMLKRALEELKKSNKPTAIK